ncbi:MAG: (Fe-S)-binding protein [Betaproteobacteria bacterium]
MRVGFFVTCLVDLMRPSIGFAALRLLEANGAQVIVPEAQTCCGQPAYNSGDRAATIALARKLVAEFEDCDYLVAPSGSCSGMISTHYPELFADDATMLARVQRLAAKTFELTDFLVNVLKVSSLANSVSNSVSNNVSGTFAGKVTYHDCCAGLREMGVKTQPRTLLAKVPGVHLTEMVECETCCGFGGTFSIKFGEISARLADNKCENIVNSGADAVVLGDLGCMLNIEGRLRRRGDTTTRVLHIAEVLAGEVN